MDSLLNETNNSNILFQANYKVAEELGVSPIIGSQFNTYLLTD